MASFFLPWMVIYVLSPYVCIRGRKVQVFHLILLQCTSPPLMVQQQLFQQKNEIQSWLEIGAQVDSWRNKLRGSVRIHHSTKLSTKKEIYLSSLNLNRRRRILSKLARHNISSFLKQAINHGSVIFCWDNVWSLKSEQNSNFIAVLCRIH